MKTPPKGRSGRKGKRERPSPTTSTEGNTPKKINLNASSSEANSEEEDREENDELAAAFKLITRKNRRKKNKHYMTSPANSKFGLCYTPCNITCITMQL